MAASLGIFMLIEGRPIEAAQSVRIVGKVSWPPIENDGQSGSVASVDQGSKIGWAAEATGRREEHGRLIAPGSIEGMLADREKFDVGEAHLVRVSRQFLRQLAVAQPTAALLMPPPRSEMDLIDRYRRAQPVDPGPTAFTPSNRLCITPHPG